MSTSLSIKCQIEISMGQSRPSLPKLGFQWAPVSLWAWISQIYKTNASNRASMITKTSMNNIAIGSQLRPSLKRRNQMLVTMKLNLSWEHKCLLKKNNWCWLRLIWIQARAASKIKISQKYLIGKHSTLRVISPSLWMRKAKFKKVQLARLEKRMIISMLILMTHYLMQMQPINLVLAQACQTSKLMRWWENKSRRRGIAIGKISNFRQLIVKNAQPSSPILFTKICQPRYSLFHTLVSFWPKTSFRKIMSTVWMLH